VKISVRGEDTREAMGSPQGREDHREGEDPLKEVSIPQKPEVLRERVRIFARW